MSKGIDGRRAIKMGKNSDDVDKGTNYKDWAIHGKSMKNELS
jgi:hypothetical protein